MPTVVPSLVQLGVSAPEERTSLRIGDLAKATGKTQRALRLYEELGLLEPGTRTVGGFRVYDAQAVARVGFISKLQELGFTLQEITELVRATDTETPARDVMERVRAVFAEKQAELTTQIERLQQLQKELTSSLAYLEKCVDACTAHEPGTGCCCRCRTHGDEKAPSLVEGMRT